MFKRFYLKYSPLTFICNSNFFFFKNCKIIFLLRLNRLFLSACAYLYNNNILKNKKRKNGGLSTETYTLVVCFSLLFFVTGKLKVDVNVKNVPNSNVSIATPFQFLIKVRLRSSQIDFEGDK